MRDGQMHVGQGPAVKKKPRDPRLDFFRGAALFTFTYIPLFLNIIPMYVIVLAMIPAAMLLARVHPLLVPATSFVLWLAANRFEINFVGDPSTGFPWYFNPLAWQLIFFAGFA